MARRRWRRPTAFRSARSTTSCPARPIGTWRERHRECRKGNGRMKIEEQQWQKITAALMAVVSTTLVTGTTVLHWQIGTEGQTALVNEASVILTLLGVILYGANSTTKAALAGY